MPRKQTTPSPAAVKPKVSSGGAKKAPGAKKVSAAKAKAAGAKSLESSKNRDLFNQISFAAQLELTTAITDSTPAEEVGLRLPLSRLELLLATLTPYEWEAVVEERVAMSWCGWPRCPKSLASHLSVRKLVLTGPRGAPPHKRSLQHASDLVKCCSTDCEANVRMVAGVVPTDPLWSRQELLFRPQAGTKSTNLDKDFVGALLDSSFGVSKAEGTKETSRLDFARLPVQIPPLKLRWLAPSDPTPSTTSNASSRPISDQYSAASGPDEGTVRFVVAERPAQPSSAPAPFHSDSTAIEGYTPATNAQGSVLSTASEGPKPILKDSRPSAGKKASLFAKSVAKPSEPSKQASFQPTEDEASAKFCMDTFDPFGSGWQSDNYEDTRDDLWDSDSDNEPSTVPTLKHKAVPPISEFVLVWNTLEGWFTLESRELIADLPAQLKAAAAATAGDRPATTRAPPKRAKDPKRVVTGDEDEDEDLVPLVDSLEAELVRKGVALSFIQAKIKSVLEVVLAITIESEASGGPSLAVKLTEATGVDLQQLFTMVQVLLGTFNFRGQIAGLQAAHWAVIAFVLLKGLSKVLPDSRLGELLEAKEESLRREVFPKGLSTRDHLTALQAVFVNPFDM